MLQILWPLALLTIFASGAPARPKPNFNWDTIPIAFHGANRTGPYNAAAIETLAKYSLVTIEKWYTKCGSLHPFQAGPECDVEKAMFSTFRDIKEANQNVTTIMYLNSMFDFSMYNLHGLALKLEAAGERVLLRDKNDDLVLLCNDGNYFCNVTNFDWSKQAARDLWISEVVNATRDGGVDGIFADHASAMLTPADKPKICNGAGTKRRCYDFTPEVAKEFNAGHQWIVDHAQDTVAPLGGPVVDGPYARWGVPACDFEALRRVVQAGQNGTGPYVIEASRGACDPDESCLAAFLCAAAEYTYLACFADEPTYHKVPALARPLGPPLGQASEGADGVWMRAFSSGTVARWYSKVSKGTIQWPGQPVPPAPGHPVKPNTTAQCGKLMEDVGQSQADIGAFASSSAQDCCDRCSGHKDCLIWAWHAEQKPQMCHLHTAEATANHKPGCFSGRIANRTMVFV